MVSTIAYLRTFRRNMRKYLASIGFLTKEQTILSNNDN